jgi:hypothetical protein
MRGFLLIASAFIVMVACHICDEALARPRDRWQLFQSQSNCGPNGCPVPAGAQFKIKDTGQAAVAEITVSADVVPQPVEQVAVRQRTVTYQSSGLRQPLFANRPFRRILGAPFRLFRRCTCGG